MSFIGSEEVFKENCGMIFEVSSWWLYGKGGRVLSDNY